MPKQVVTRFAPSPTGFLHVGGLRTALYNFLFAQKNQGRFLFRIEDTDQKRAVPGAMNDLKKILKSFGLKWDNKKIIIQSKRLKIYQKFGKQLITQKKAYYCFCPEERLAELRKNQIAQNLPPRYDGLCRNLEKTEIEKKLKSDLPYVIRFKIPQTGITEFNDLIRGKVSFDNKILDDQILIKSDGFPTYHLASVTDDHEMRITHVIRGEEWLPSTPKHILLYEALGWEKPEFAHLPLLLNPDRSKLSKRQGDISVEEYLKKGYLPETLLNFILLLGWNPGTNQEIFSLKEMIKIFSLEKINKAGAVFDLQKLDWLNGYYLRHLSLKELAKLSQPFFKAAGIKKGLKTLEPVVATEQQRIKKLEEIVMATEFFFQEPTYDKKLLLWKQMSSEQAAKNLKILLAELNLIAENDWQQKKLENKITNFINDQKLSIGEMLWPMRVALTGRQASPGNFEVAAILGKKKTLERIKYAIALLEK
ncbi:MAG: glutamate--tRNA ligase [Candidatus Buchananbacteria bacterium RIFCSPHIGHO2_02_FULL_39_17]|nr:MAG: glutamate--tRNA ligase [Candidatus Buchananbacteria bacterium RIFCSPHIGHO2_02_FULL_39_17]